MDDLLVKRLQSGDKSAFEEFISRYENQIYSVAFHLLRNQSDAQDAAQESILKIYKSIRRFKNWNAIGAWVYRVTLNTCLDELRKRDKTPPVSLDWLSEKGAQIPSIDPLPDALAQKSILKKKIFDTLETLQDEYRTVLVLRDMMDMSYNEIAQITGLSPETVKSRIYRARNMLQSKLSGIKELFY